MQLTEETGKEITKTYEFSLMLEQALKVNRDVVADMIGDLDAHNEDDLNSIRDYCDQLALTAKFLKLYYDPSRAKNRGTNIATWKLTNQEYDYLRYVVTQYHNLRDEDPKVEEVFNKNNLYTYNLVIEQSREGQQN